MSSGHVQDRHYTEKDGKRVRTSFTGRRWKARYRSGGKEYAKSFDRERDAKRWLTSELSKIERRTWIDPHAGRVTYEEWRERWDGYRPTNEESTEARDESYHRNHVLTAVGGLPLETIDAECVQRFVNGLKAKNLKPSTITKIYQQLSKTMTAAVEKGIISSSPCTKAIKLPKIPVAEMMFISPEEVAVLALSIDPRYRLFPILGAYSGLRPGELLAVRVGSLDETRNMIRVTEAVKEVRGRLSIGGPKTQKGTRSVPIPASVMAELMKNSEGKAPSDLIFTLPGGEPVRISNFRRRVWYPATAAAEVPGLRMHDLRHTCVSFWIASHHATSKEIAEWAGHRSVATVINRYGHLYPGTEGRAMAALDAAFQEAQLKHHPAPKLVVLSERRATA